MALLGVRAVPCEVALLPAVPAGDGPALEGLRAVEGTSAPPAAESPTTATAPATASAEASTASTAAAPA